ncbi:MAG TPA: S53 family peptidase [Candidatus Sulfotelmatobacter sp.]|nr:S53 family peptidase [Candidatus Sulfotelmatobacter sp.]
MKLRVFVIAAALVLAPVLSNSANAQVGHRGHVVVPDSSIPRAGDAGKRAHTNIRLFIPDNGFNSVRHFYGPPYSGYFFETPASIGCLYKLTKAVTGCNPNTASLNPAGGAKAIALVDAYDYPHAASDLATFSTQFGLPAATFQVVYASGTKPPGNLNWELEEALDIEWAHAMAPNAAIYLVEAASNSFSDLFLAVQVASNLVATAGGGEVSMSWGSGEFSSETSYDSYFTTPGIVYFASTGDAPGTSYPSVSPNVVAAGGTTIRRFPDSGNFKAEFAWSDAGGGLSDYEPRPGYQSVISGLVGNQRGVPDFSAIADPNTGVWVYDSGNGGWWIMGGTSVSSPMIAGIVNKAGGFATSSAAELTTIYNNLGVAGAFGDITAGYCGPYMGYNAEKGWDICTGVGTARGSTGK